MPRDETSGGLACPKPVLDSLMPLPWPLKQNKMKVKLTYDPRFDPGHIMPQSAGSNLSTKRGVALQHCEGYPHLQITQKVHIILVLGVQHKNLTLIYLVK